MKKEMKVGKQEKGKPAAAKVKEAPPKSPPKDRERDDKETASVPEHEQKGKHSEEATVEGSKRISGKKQMQSN